MSERDGVPWDAFFTLQERVKRLENMTDIVFCKDCKYWEVDTDVGFCTRTEDCDWDANDFCSKGEKR